MQTLPGPRAVLGKIYGAREEVWSVADGIKPLFCACKVRPKSLSKNKISRKLRSHLECNLGIKDVTDVWAYLGLGPKLDTMLKKTR